MNNTYCGSCSSDMSRTNRQREEHQGNDDHNGSDECVVDGLPIVTLR